MLEALRAYQADLLARRRLMARLDDEPETGDARLAVAGARDALARGDVTRLAPFSQASGTRAPVPR